MNLKGNIMKNIIIFFLFFGLCQITLSQEKKLNIIAIGAHPDDCDFKFGGTAALFAKMGHNVKFLSLTNLQNRGQYLAIFHSQ